MKRKLSLLLVLVMVSSFLLACTPSNVTPPENTGEKDADQYLNVLLSAEPSVLDVARFLGIVDRSIFMNVLEPLTRIQDGQIVGAGAETWDISDDGLTYTFYLRENYWSDGKPVTAQDYITALQRQADPANAFAFANDYYSIKNFAAINEGDKDVSEIGASAPDERTLVLELASVNVSLLSTTDFFPDREDIAQLHRDSLGTEADKRVYCGPFALEAWSHNSQLDLVKHEQYWNSDNVILNKVSYMIIPDSNAQLASLENGSLDYLSVSLPEYVAKFQGRDDMSETLISAGRTVMVVFNCEDSVFENAKIRLAFSLALDREALVNVITNDTATPAFGLVPHDCSVGNLNFRENATEPLVALDATYSDPKALLIEGMQELGLGADPSALTVRFAWGATTAAARTYAELYQQLWQEALGCNVELEFNDNATHMSNVNSGNYQMASMSWGSNYEPQFQLSRWATPIGGQSRWKNAEYVSLVNRAAQTVDENERLALYAEAEKLLVEDAAIAPLYFTANRRFHYNYVQGLTANTFDNVGLMYIYTSGR